jgi:hypothetical protein
MDSMSPIRDQMATLYGASTDVPHVMGVAVDLLADLHNATLQLGRALVDAGLPKRSWRSEQATLRLLSPALPAITIDAFLTRLEQFAERDGPRWLHGTHDELVVFHRGMVIVANVARPLQEVADRLPPLPVDIPGRPRENRALQRVMRHRALQAPLDIIVAILNDLEALAPSMRPLTPEQWRAVRRARRGPVARLQGMVAAWASSLQMRWRRGAPSSSAAASKAAPEGTSATAPEGTSATAPGAANARSVLGMGGALALQRPSLLRRRGRAQGWLAVVALCIAVGVGLAVFVFARQPHTTSQTPSLSSSAVLTALAGSGTAAASATDVATLSPTPRPTLAPTPKLALTCAVQGATATLTLKNVSALPLTWQAQPPPTLTVSPAQGALQPGQSASVQVSTVNKKTVSGTIAVVASHDTLSTQDKVPCR